MNGGKLSIRRRYAGKGLAGLLVQQAMTVSAFIGGAMVLGGVLLINRRGAGGGKEGIKQQ